MIDVSETSRLIIVKLLTGRISGAFVTIWERSDLYLYGSWFISLFPLSICLSSYIYMYLYILFLSFSLSLSLSIYISIYLSIYLYLSLNCVTLCVKVCVCLQIWVTGFTVNGWLDNKERVQPNILLTNNAKLRSVCKGRQVARDERVISLSF